jgi:hypothetical protein
MAICSWQKNTLHNNIWRVRKMMWFKLNHILSTILVKNIGALDTDCVKFDSHINNKHSNPPFPHSMLCVVFYMSKVLCNIDKGGRGCLDMKFCIQWAGMYIVIRNKVKVMLFRLSAPRIFDLNP